MATLKSRINAAIKDWPEDPKSKHKLNAGQRREAIKMICTKIINEALLGISPTLDLIQMYAKELNYKRFGKSAKRRGEKR